MTVLLYVWCRLNCSFSILNVSTVHCNELIYSNRATYLVKKKIGEGAYGEVFKCLNKHTDEIVAVKCIDHYLIEDYFREVRMLYLSCYFSNCSLKIGVFCPSFWSLNCCRVCPLQVTMTEHIHSGFFGNDNHFVRLLDHFRHKNQFCLVYEMLDREISYLDENQETHLCKIRAAAKQVDHWSSF